MKKLFLTSTLFFVFAIGIAQISPQERQVLLDFYTATQGDQWSQSWDITQPASAWQGVTIEDNKVIGLSLLFNNIQGALPASLGQLEHLKVLELSFNKLSGPIPQEIGELQNLETLALNANDLTGSIPSSLGNLTKLKQFHLSSNKLKGKVPASLAALSQLEVFNVFDNNLYGSLPLEIGRISTLEEMVVAENNFTNLEDFSVVLMTNAGVLDLKKQPTLTPATKSVIAIETSDDEN